MPNTPTGEMNLLQDIAGINAEYWPAGMTRSAQAWSWLLSGQGVDSVALNPAHRHKTALV